MQKLTMKARNEVLPKETAKYRKASKKEKGIIIDTVCEATGLGRDRVARVLSKGIATKSTKSNGKRGPKKKYGLDVVVALRKVWYALDNACGKRVAEGMAGMLDALIRFNEIDITQEVEEKLLQMSPATIDRLLKKDREQFILKGKSTTKPGTLLKKDIPIRTGTEWDENMPGYVEIDLVAHCGVTTAGEYVNTLDVTDIFTGWTETEAILNKAQIHTLNGLKNIRRRFPFKLRGFDSDNGAEFINYDLKKYCDEEGILFTRSRPYRKNDNCHVEQKNWSLVRRNIGYQRYEGQEAVDLLNKYYQMLRLLSNYFFPNMKLIFKTRDGAKVIKKYDRSKTPYQRAIESGVLTQAEKEIHDEIYHSINPSKLQRDMLRTLDKIKEFVVKQNGGQNT